MSFPWETLVLAGVVIGILVITTITAISRYKTCPSNKILVKYGKVGKGRSALPIHGGATFVWPVIQNFAFMDLTPITTDIDLRGALSKQNIRVNVPSRFTFGIGTTEELMGAAAERLLHLTAKEIEDMAQDIIFGQLRATIATMDIEEINADRETFESNVMNNIETELAKIGLRLINVNISDITDASGYIEALGKRAAAGAVNQAKIDVAERDRDGAVGSAQAEQEERTKVANANAQAVKGENSAKEVEAASDAGLKVKQAEAKRLSDAAAAVQAAEALKEGYEAEKIAEETRAEKVRATENADKVVPAEIAKQTAVIEAEAEKEVAIKEGEGEGGKVQARMQGEAEGHYSILSKKAEGFKLLVQAAGGDPKAAVMLMVAEQLPQIAALQAAAIANIKFDKIVVMDGGTGGGGGSTTANWLAGITKALPGLHEFAEMAGINLPDSLGEIMGSPETAGLGKRVSPSPSDV